jgi:ABC-type transporter Mla subunit MlaD
MSDAQPEDVQLISQLRSALSDAREDIWDLVERLELTLESDPRQSEEERTLLAQVRAGVSDVIATRREGRQPDLTRASAPLRRLETMIRKRTTGPDGWPLA